MDNIDTTTLMDMLDKEKAYIENSGQVCPFCNSKNITAGPIHADGATAWGSVTCEGCGEFWTDHYKLVSISW